MKTMVSTRWLSSLTFQLSSLLLFTQILPAQVLLNINFGAAPGNAKGGHAAAGILTNDVWNAYSHYDPKFTPGMALVSNGRMDKLRFHDGSDSRISVAVTNAPGVWGNSSGDAMFDSYIFSQNGSNITVALRGLPAGRYHFYLYGHADADVSAEQNPVFTLRTGTNTLGPQTPSGGIWKAGQPWVERAQYVVFRDVSVESGEAIIDVAAGPGGIPVLNGLQVLSRGTSPPRIARTGPAEATSANTNLMVRSISYDGKVSDAAARFDVQLTVESMTTNEISTPLFEGDVALVSPELPKGLHILSEGKKTRLICSVPGIHQIKLQLLAKITRAEPWNTISLCGPDAAIASVSAEAEAAGVELEMRSGTQVTPMSAQGTNVARSRITGFLGADRALSLRWQSRGAEVSRKSLLTVDTTATAELTPTVVKFQTAFRYDILQAAVPRLKILLPASHALTRIQGDQIRDWQIGQAGEAQELTVEFIRPVDKSCSLTLFSEQTLTSAAGQLALEFPRPQEVQRESGSVTLKVDDTTCEVESVSGLRQINAPAGAIAAYKFNARPISLKARMRRIEPVLNVADRITARLEEMRLQVSHTLNLTVEKAGIYAIELTPQPGFTVAEVTGDGIDEWKTPDGRLNITFKSRVLGSRKLSVQLEKANREFPEKIELLPLRVSGVTNTITHLGAVSSPGIRLKTDSLSNLREIPANTLPERRDELLAFVSEQPSWKLALAVEKLPPRVVSEVFNLITIGDGLVGGSATIRYGIINQGVQEFRLAVPAHWRNIEFTGPMIRRKEQSSNVWTITLQDKAWGAYTLVVTYDYQFDPKGATLDLAGAHTLGVEREAGSLGLMTAATLKLTPAAPKEPLRRVDEAELSETDRALCTRPLLLAYKYTGPVYAHSVQVTRFEELTVLEAVADRTELTTVLTEEGQLLTQSSFMVKNNQKQFQRFKLPEKAELWSSYVNGQPAKPEKDGDWYLVPLPREANRDQAFAVEIVYAQKMDIKSSLFPRKVNLTAPLTDIPNTYAEWQLFAPSSRRLSGFGGNMTVATGTIYGLHEAWQQFLGFYGDLIEHHLGAIIAWFVFALVIALIVVAVRRGFQGALTVIALFAICAILAAMLLPALSKAKSRAQRINSVNNLKQIGLAAKTWAMDNGNVFPPSYEAMKEELSTDKITYDPKTGQRYVYLGAGKTEANPEAIIAYSASDSGGREVLFADGSVQMMSQEKFDQAMQRDAAVPRTVIASGTAGLDQVTRGVTAGAVAESAPAAPPADSSTVQAGRPIAVAPPQGQPAEIPATMGGFGGGVAATATGVRPIRIDIPRAGQAFSFTKVLNTGREPLRLTASVVRLGVYRTFYMILQVTLFVVGLVLFCLLWIGAALAGHDRILTNFRRSLFMSIAMALVIWSVASLLMMWRLLHVGLIVVVPVIVAAVAIWAGRGLWLHHKASKLHRKVELPPAEPGTIVPLLLASLLLAANPLMAQEQRAAAPAPAQSPANPQLSILSARYSGTAGDKVGSFEGRIVVSAVSTNQTVPFFGPEVAVETFQATGDARLVRNEQGLGLFLPNRGQSTIDVRFVVKVSGDVTRRKLAFALPQALASQVELLIEEPDAEVEFPVAVAFEKAADGQRTKVSAVLGAAERYDMSWTPRVKRAAEVSATVFVQNTALITIGAGVINTRASLDYQVSQGELKQLQVRVPADHRVLRVEGESLRVWEANGDLLTVELLKGISPNYKLTIETEKPLETLPAAVRVEIPHAVGIKRETGLVAFRGSEEVSLVQQTASDLQRVDSEEFQRASPGLKDATVSAYRFLDPEFVLALRVDAVQPQIEAVLKQKVRIGAESARLVAQVDYVIKRAGVFGLKMAIPAGYRVEGVSGQNIAQWVERLEGSIRQIEVTLKERTTGSYSLHCVLVENYKEAPVLFRVPGVHPIGIDKLTGYVTVAAEPGLAVKTGALEGLAEIPSGSSLLPAETGREEKTGETSALGYKFTATAPAALQSTEAPWALSVSTEAVDPWVRAEIFNDVTLAETLVSGRTQVKYEIVNAPTREFRLRIPAAFKNVEIIGAQIRRRDQTNEEWRVELQSKVRGEYMLTITWEMPGRKYRYASTVAASGWPAH